MLGINFDLINSLGKTCLEKPTHYAFYQLHQCQLSNKIIYTVTYTKPFTVNVCMWLHAPEKYFIMVNDAARAKVPQVSSTQCYFFF